MARTLAGPAGLCIMGLATLALVWWEADRIASGDQRRSTRSVLPVVMLVTAALGVGLVRFRVLA